ncbi:unnamed protein product [Mytilus edulis]|uniref:Uncharacterized protein n=1 Tax=Mytilus edulis TaxID=6550 RepID=A0A8S3SW70_MYTED|nr:unnamed protein product [Mytilus edulis]
MSNFFIFDGTAPLGWSLLKADIESTAFWKGWNSEQKLQTLVSRITGKAFKFYENRSNTVQADYETLEYLPYPDELLDEFTDRIEELVEGAFQNESENAKEHLVIKYLTNACCDEEGKELVKAVAEGSVYVAKSYLCVLAKCNRYLKLNSLWEPEMKNKRDVTNLQIEQTDDQEPIVRNQGKEKIVYLEEKVDIVHEHNDEPEYHNLSKHLSEEKNYAMETRESPKKEEDYLSETDKKRANTTYNSPMFK